MVKCIRFIYLVYYMITCHLLGGLGNQLFQIFTTLSYSMDCKNTPAFLNKPNTYGATNRTTYWNTFFIYLQKWIYNKIEAPFRILKEKSFCYNELPINEDSGNIRLDGYFQSPKYFEHNKNKITHLIGLDIHKKKNKKTYSIRF